MNSKIKNKKNRFENAFLKYIFYVLILFFSKKKIQDHSPTRVFRTQNETP